MSSQTAELQRLDTAHYMHPFTDHAVLHRTGARVMERAQGIYMWDTQGNRLIDGLAGLGNVILGYGRDDLVNAAATQMKTLSYCPTFFHTTHPAVARLSHAVTARLPPSLNRVFFQNSGSEANETAVKLVRRYWELQGMPGRQTIIAREAAYHGSTAMAASLSGIGAMHHAGGMLPLPGITRIRAPYWYRNGRDMDPDAFGLVAAGWLEDEIVRLGPENVAAFFAEPAQSAGGAICPPMTYWPEIERICRKYDVLLVADEVVCGFGRTGAWFGIDHYGFTPDIMQLGKGITSGYLPLSACVISDRVADAVCSAGEEWAHGFTYSGHPACCAVALETMHVLERDRVVDHVRDDVAPYFHAGLRSFADHPLVGDVRMVGMLGGLELVRDKATAEPWPAGSGIGDYCSAQALQRGLALRANGDTMSLMPPLVITRAELDDVFTLVRQALDATLAHFGCAA